MYVLLLSPYSLEPGAGIRPLMALVMSGNGLQDTELGCLGQGFRCSRSSHRRRCSISSGSGRGGGHGGGSGGSGTGSE